MDLKNRPREEQSDTAGISSKRQKTIIISIQQWDVELLVIVKSRAFVWHLCKRNSLFLHLDVSKHPIQAHQITCVRSEIRTVCLR